ncbi:MAG: hypothetical protein ACI9VR_002466 [Cognaticolwellia sp.]|jgi:hypothetical protein
MSNLEKPVLRSPHTSFAALAGLLLLSTGCVHVYQPMSGLNDPMVIDPGAQNFPDLRLNVVCIQGDLLNRQEATVLCENAGTLFRNQGAQVTTRIGQERSYSGARAAAEDEEERPVDLTLELTSRKVHTFNDPVSWTLCILSASIVPAVSESSFALDVVIRDGSGFLLATDTMEGRIIKRVGVGTWALEKALDLTRDEDEKIAKDAAEQNLSADLYGQLTQMVFNAQMQWEVLQQVPPVER